MNHVPTPGFPEFRADYEQGRGHLVWTRSVSDLETPVAAYLKLGEGKPNSFLLESVEGGASRGRYSIIGLAPDLIWRCRDGRPEINRHARAAPFAFVPDDRAAARQSARAHGGDAAGGAGRAAADGAAGWSAISATTWCGRWSGCREKNRDEHRRAGQRCWCARPCSPSSTTSPTC